MKQIDVTALGELLIDFTDNGRSKSGNLLFEANPGGAPCNVLAMLAKLNKKTAFIGKVGADMFGTLLENAVKSVGISAEGLVKDKNVSTTLAFVQTLKGGEREFSFVRNPGADMMLNANEVNESLIQNSKIFHFGTLSSTDEPAKSATRHAIEIAEKSGTLLSFDPNLRERLWHSLEDAKAEIAYGFSKCNILKISDNEIEFMFGHIDYEKAAEFKSRECALNEQIAALEPQCKSTVLTAEDVAKVVELWANVPVSKLSLHESEQLMNLENAIKKKIIGQDSAADRVAKAIRRKRAGVEGRLRPASFIFVGPTGVGKTEMVKVLAEELFGSKDDLIRLDMTEYSEQHSVSKLIGSPPGYVGYDEAGQLTEKVRRKPYSVILFDEIEKAHSSIYNILLQILDEGRLTDSQGRVVNFENTVVILTSNAGIGFGTESLGFAGKAEAEDTVANDKLKQIFKPELLNRVDEIVVFNRLKPEDFVQIADIIIGEMQNALLEKGITLEVTQNAKELLAHEGYSERYGARELRREIQRKIGDRIADIIVSGDAPFGTQMTVDEKGGELSISF